MAVCGCGSLCGCTAWTTSASSGIHRSLTLFQSRFSRWYIWLLIASFPGSIQTRGVNKSWWVLLDVFSCPFHFTSLCHMHKSSFPPAFPSVASVCSITLSCFKDKNLSILSQASRGFLHLQLKGCSAPLPMSPTTACKHLLRAFSIAFIFQMSSVLVRIPRASSPP